MNPSGGTGRRAALVLGLAFLASSLPASAPAVAQLVQVKTIPLATGDQFLVRPTTRLGMAGVSAAVDDTLGDPFVNPAKGARLETGWLLGSPTLYHVTEGNGSGRTLPLSGLLTSGAWFGGLSVAVQEIVGPDRAFRDFSLTVAPDPFPSAGNRLDERSSTNTYLSGFAGRRLGAGWAVAGAVRWAGLDAVDGVEHLYPRARRLDQSGSVQDYRLGVIRDRPAGSRLELLVLHRRFEATHAVQTVEWDPQPAGFPCRAEARWCREWTASEEVHRDRTNTTGVHLGWDRALDEPGWRVGGFLTANRKDHPEIPNYDLMNIPRDPGTTWAWNLGLGLSRTLSQTTWAVDAIFEPVWTETWAEAAASTTTEDGGTIPAGGHTVDNEFFFRNVALRLAGSRELGPASLQLGLALRSVSYELEQTDRVQGDRRVQDESWMVWTPTWGGALNLDALTVRYQGGLTTGTGRPGVAGPVMADAASLETGGVDFIPAPEGPLTLQDARVWTHQLSVEVPVR